VTGQVGGQWSCSPAAIFARSTVEGVRGDVFGLAGRTRVPFELSRDRTTIDALKRALEARDPAGGQSAPAKDCDGTIAQAQG
jgi:hypothetical protein